MTLICAQYKKVDISLLTNVVISEDVLIINEADHLQEELINKNEGTKVTNTYVEHEVTLFHKESLLKHAMSSSTFPKSLDRK